MLGRLILLFLLTPAVELALLIQVDQVIGFWPTVGLIVVTGIVGSHLARREGLSTWRRLNNRLQRGNLPGTELADGVIILVAGALLITPGILTDVLGFIGLIPFTRAYLRRVVMRWFRRKMEQGTMQVQFGVFGGAGGSPGTPPSAPSGPPDPSSDDTWRGRSRQVPDHAENSPDGDASSS
ncbi:MAG: FxsA family protein [Salinibacter sp.]